MDNKVVEEPEVPLEELVAEAGSLLEVPAADETSLEPVGRDRLGRFQKGMVSVRKGKKQPDFGPALASIQRAFPSEEIGERLAETYELARASKSAKAMLSVLELVLSYQFGKPVQRQLNVGASLEEFRALFASDEEGEGEIVDVSHEIVA